MSLKLMRSSLTVLRLDKELMLYPLTSALTMLLFTTAFIYASYVSGFADRLLESADKDGTINDPLLFILVLVFYFITHFIITFFNTALIASALIRFEGKNPTLADGLNSAISRLNYIIAWSLLAASVSFILKVIEKRSGAIQGIVAGIVGLAWSVCSYLVIPFLVQEKLYPFAALKKSSELIKRTWGPALVAEFGLGLLGMILFVLGFGIFWLFQVMGIPMVYAIPSIIIYWVILWLVASTLNGIIIAGVYQYGVTGKVPEGFSKDQISNAFHR